MNFLILIFCFAIFSFVVYVFSRDDFVILRTNTSLEKIFNIIYIATFFSLFTSRVFYILFHPKSTFFTFLGFLLFPYFPGLSLISGLSGGYLFSYLILRAWGFPIGKILDIFSMGFLISFPIGFFLTNFLNGERSAVFYIASILFLVPLLVLTRFVFPMSLSGKLKDGRLSILFMLSFSFTYLLSRFLMFGKIFLDLENVESFLIFLIFLGIIVWKENLIAGLISRIKKLNRKNES